MRCSSWGKGPRTIDALTDLLERLERRTEDVREYIEENRDRI